MSRRIALPFFIICMATLFGTPMPTDQNSAKKYKIAVIGNGVPGADVFTAREFSLNRSQAVAMWEGVKAAYDSSPTVARIKDLIDLYPVDDGDRAENAIREACAIQKDPYILAAIGHSASSPTHAAAPYYAEVGIPLVMPIATSKYVMFPDTVSRQLGKSLNNTFRLPPSDQFQARVVAYSAKAIIGAKTIYIIKDVSPEAIQYSEPLFEDINRLLKWVKYGTIDQRSPKYSDLLQDISTFSPDLVVFVGYASSALGFLKAMNNQYGAEKIRPKILFTDGCKDRELDLSTLDIYLTFPAPSVEWIRERGGHSRDLEILAGLVGARHDESYEIYGYDAMLLIAQAVFSSRGKNLSRNTIRSSLGNLDLSGCWIDYRFRKGENHSKAYYLYHSQPSAKQRTPGLSVLREIMRKDVDDYFGIAEE